MEDRKTGLAGLDDPVLSHPLKVESTTQEDKQVKLQDNKPLEVKSEPTDEYPVDAGIKGEDVTECLRTRLSNLKIKIECRHEEDIHSAGSLSNSEPQTPACKGVGYTIEWSFVDRFFGSCQYFVAPIKRHQDFSEYAVFSLSASQRTVSLVDDNSTHCWYPILDYPSDTVVRFGIGGLTYQWNTQINSLAFELPESQPGISGAVAQLNYVQLLDDLNVANDEAKRLQEQSRHFCVVVPNRMNTIPIGQGRPHQRGYFSGRSSSGSSSIGSEVSFSPPAEVMHSPREMGSPVGATGYFSGASAKQEAIDRWVDGTAAARRTIHETGNMKCPEVGCGASSRRPHALKTHLYTHYGIRPVKCKLCSLHVLTDANLVRHVKNAHTCPASGCPSVAPILDLKAHKAICPQAAKAATANKRKKGRARTPAVTCVATPNQSSERFCSPRTH